MTFAPSIDVPVIMRLVLLALLPGIGVFIYQSGWGGVVNLVIACVTAVSAEAYIAFLRKRPVLTTINDNTALVTAVLLALCLPPLLPWWITVLAVLFAIVLAKQVYGGIGQNVFNPAMAGYALILISYPLDLSSWPHIPDAFSTSLSQTINIMFSGGMSQMPNYDALTGATALSELYDLKINHASPDQIEAAIKGEFGAIHSEWINLAYLLGGLMLLYLRIITWHLPLSLLAGLSVSHLLFGASYPDLTLHLFSGATMLCAFFIVTDPVSAPIGTRGKLLFGFVAGVLIYCIRHFGGYPDGVAFAILLMNCCVPLIDRIDSHLYGSGR